ncbi:MULTISPECIES: hypothetical protein [unclassified Cryobacterium]|uniref:hypothetical protein n=1 Tax=unclassified Cryobacterium TaxID=2649013 RepID=UPI0018E07BEC|nr:MULTISPECIES: hypothetical protein [unclassified Cryobacterium]
MNGPLISSTASHPAPTDFDFVIGDWTVHHERLDGIFVGADTWTAFEGLSSTNKILGGHGNLEDNLLRHPSGDFHAVALRSYSVADGEWSIWWLDGRNPTQLDTPVRGAFRDGIGTFLAEDVLEGVPIRVRFIWDATGLQPTWEQAFSNDAGLSWETNWRMTFRRA